MSRRESRRLFSARRRGEALLEQPGVVGVGLGEDERGGECLVVLVDGELPPRERERCLRRVRGVPTVVVDTGVLRALGDPRDG